MWEYIAGILMAPVQTLREIAEKKLWKQGLLIIVAIALIKGVANAVTARDNPILPPGLEMSAGLHPVLQSMLSVFQSPYFLIGSSLVGGIVTWFVGGLLFYGFGKLFKGQGTLTGILASTGYADAPYFIGIPLTVLLTLLGRPGAILGGFVGFGMGVWTFALDVLAVRESLGISTWAALITVLIPLMLLFCSIFLMGVLMAAGAIFSAP